MNPGPLKPPGSTFTLDDAAKKKQDLLDAKNRRSKQLIKARRYKPEPDDDE
jgi:hypothetical protein